MPQQEVVPFDLMVTPEFIDTVRTKAAQAKKTVTQYLQDLVAADSSEDDFDAHLAAQADQISPEDFIGHEKSSALLERMKNA